MPLTILGIAGSLRKASFNRALLRAAGELAPPDVTIESFDLSPIPPFNEDIELPPPASVIDLKARIRAADAILFATPEYNYSIPGVLKNAIDWASRPYGDNAWSGKPAAVMSASVGNLGGVRAQYHLRQVFVFLNVHDMKQPELMIASAAHKFDAQGNLSDERTREYMRKFLAAFVRHVKRWQHSSSWSEK